MEKCVVGDGGGVPDAETLLVVIPVRKTTTSTVQVQFPSSSGGDGEGVFVAPQTIRHGAVFDAVRVSRSVLRSIPMYRDDARVLDPLCWHIPSPHSMHFTRDSVERVLAYRTYHESVSSRQTYGDALCPWDQTFCREITRLSVPKWLDVLHVADMWQQTDLIEAVATHMADLMWERTERPTLLCSLFGVLPAQQAELEHEYRCTRNGGGGGGDDDDEDSTHNKNEPPSSRPATSCSRVSSS